MKKSRILFPSTMFARFLTSHILLVTLPLLVTMLFLIGAVRTAMHNTILSYSQEVVVRSAEQIDLTLENIYNLLKRTAANPFLSDSGLNRAIVIEDMVLEFPVFKEVTVLGLDGKVVLSTAHLGGNGAAGKWDLSGEIFGKLISGLPHSSEVYLNELSLPEMRVLEPIRAGGDEIIAILGAKVDLKEIWRLVDKCKIGDQSGEAFIFRSGKASSNGQFIAHTDRKRVLEGSHFLEEGILNRIAAHQAGSEIYMNNLEVEMAAAYAPLENKEWGIVLQQPTEEAFAVVSQIQFRIQALLLGSILLAACVAFFYSRWILKPVSALVSGINRISSGDLSHRIAAKRKDEISQVAAHFNRMATKLRTAQTKLKRTERFETLGRMASVLSHEIRNPLNSMVINMQILRREFQKSEAEATKLEHYHGIVLSEIQRVDDLVSNFLLLAKPAKLKRAAHDVRSVLDEVVTSQQPTALMQGVRIERKYDQNLPELLIDRGKIKQVILNIVINALQAMAAGGKLRIDVQFIQDSLMNEHLKFVFSDTGKGISKEDLKQVFDFYYSTKPHGSGVGLSVAQQIIEEHDGRISVESIVGKGTTVTIYLPVSEHLN